MRLRMLTWPIRMAPPGGTARTVTLLACTALVLGACVGPQASSDTGSSVSIPAVTHSSFATNPYAHAQKYWDGVVAPRPSTPPPANPSKEACEPYLREMMSLREAGSEGRPVYARPELMALGDSLYNGVQSMRINWWLSEWSAPTMVAIRMGLIDEFAADRKAGRRFYGPQYPTHGSAPSAMQDYGFSFENVPGLAGLWDLPRVQAQALRHLAFSYRPDNGRAMVDNLAFSGANSHDLLNWSADEHAKRAEVHIDHAAKWQLIPSFGALASSFFHANATFVLNPMRDPCVGLLTPIEHVEWRKPRRLLINIGPNDGMWQLAFTNPDVSQAACDGEASDKEADANLRGTQNGNLRCTGPGVSIRDSMLQAYRENIEALLKRLAKIDDPKLEQVVINGLPIPSQTANLTPMRTRQGVVWYSDAMNGSRRRTTFTTAQIEVADALINDVNHQVQALVTEANARSGGHRFVWVDLAAQLSRYDAKRCIVDSTDAAVIEACQRSRQLVLTQARFKMDASLDNHPIRFDGESGVRTGLNRASKITQGGLFSFDNMHLSSIGYEIMARSVFEAMGPVPGAPRNACKDSSDPGFVNLRPGDCAALLVQPGWAYADATRRDYVFLRSAGLEETRNRARLSARIAFMNRLTR